MAKTTLSKLSLSDLQAELRRRERELTKLKAQRDKLASQLADLDQKIFALDGDTPRAAVGTTRRAATGKRGPRRRPRNEKPLAEVLLDVFPKDKPMKVSDAVEAAQKAGYKTTASNFSTIVNQTLIKDPRFRQVSRGYYQIAD